MRARGAVFLMVVLILFMGFAIAAEDDAAEGSETDSRVEAPIGPSEDSTTDTSETTSTETKDDEFADAQLETGAGITPNSGLYFVEDKILSQFRDDGKNREKKIAEVREMIRDGDIESARESLVRYKKYAVRLEEESDPRQRDESRRSAAAIQNALREIESEIPEDQREEFIDDVIEQEDSIVTAVKIADKIQQLCGELSKVDFDEYARVCKVGDGEDVPEWRKQHDRELTQEQREQARLFAGIMKECFKTAGQQCRCEEIPHAEFATACSAAAPLATKCEIEGDEAACEKLDNLEMPELPDYLQEEFDEIDGAGESRYDVHMPQECREAGAKTPKECMKIMIGANAPDECRDALIEADVDNEREARALCEKIMFEVNAPEECIDAGLTDHKACGRFMFEQSAPDECKEAGLTGDNPSDGRKCQKIMNELQGENREGPNRGPGRGFGPDCRRIENAEERLKCYDGALQQAGEFRDECKDNPEACRERFGLNNQRIENRGGQRDVPSECEGKSPEECGGIMQERFGNRPPEEFRDDQLRPEISPEFRGDFSEQERREEPRSDEFRQGEFENRESSFNSGEQGSNAGEGGGGGGEGSSGGGEGSISGGAISGRAVLGENAGNSFLRYFFKFK